MRVIKESNGIEGRYGGSHQIISLLDIVGWLGRQFDVMTNPRHRRRLR